MGQNFIIRVHKLEPLGPATTRGLLIFTASGFAPEADILRAEQALSKAFPAEEGFLVHTTRKKDLLP